jgi:hypothetical protein
MKADRMSALPGSALSPYSVEDSVSGGEDVAINGCRGCCCGKVEADLRQRIDHDASLQASSGFLWRLAKATRAVSAASFCASICLKRTGAGVWSVTNSAFRQHANSDAVSGAVRQKRGVARIASSMVPWRAS